MKKQVGVHAGRVDWETLVPRRNLPRPRSQDGTACGTADGPECVRVGLNYPGHLRLLWPTWVAEL